MCSSHFCWCMSGCTYRDVVALTLFSFLLRCIRILQVDRIFFMDILKCIWIHHIFFVLAIKIMMQRFVCVEIVFIRGSCFTAVERIGFIMSRLSGPSDPFVVYVNCFHGDHNHRFPLAFACNCLISSQRIGVEETRGSQSPVIADVLLSIHTYYGNKLLTFATEVVFFQKCDIFSGCQCSV